MTKSASSRFFAPSAVYQSQSDRLGSRFHSGLPVGQVFNLSFDRLESRPHTESRPDMES